MEGWEVWGQEGLRGGQIGAQQGRVTQGNAEEEGEGQRERKFPTGSHLTPRPTPLPGAASALGSSSPPVGQTASLVPSAWSSLCHTTSSVLLRNLCPWILN